MSLRTDMLASAMEGHRTMDRAEHEAAAPVRGAYAASGRVRRRPGRPTLSNEELLDRALDLFLEQGFERTSLDAITVAAGMAKRTVYQRYGDKETLFRAALKRAIDEWIVPVEALRDAERDDLEETLLGIGTILVANIMSPAGLRLLRITNAEAGRMPEIGAYTYQLGTHRTIGYLADLLQRRVGSRSGRADEWRNAAIAFLYLVVCGPPTLTAWGMELDQRMIDEHTRYGVRLFLHGLLGAGAEVPARSGDRPEEVEVAIEAGSDGSPSLEDENRRLRALLVSSLLETAALREQLGIS